MNDLLERLLAVDISWNQVGEDCAAAADEIKRLNAENARLREALEGVIRIADRDCPEFRAARAALAEKEEM